MKNRLILLDSEDFANLKRLADSKWRKGRDGEHYQLWLSMEDPTAMFARKNLAGYVITIKERK